MINPDHFCKLIETGADYLRSLSIQYTGGRTVRAPTPTVTWRAPPLFQTSYLGGVPMHALVGEMYATPLRHDEVLQVWDRAVRLLSRHDIPGLTGWLPQAQPDLPFSSPDKVGPAAVMVQFLWAASQLRGELKIESTSALYRHASDEIGFHHQRVKGHSSVHRLRKVVPYATGLHVPLGHLLRPMPETLRVCAHMVSVVPRMADTIETFIRAAVHAGQMFERIIADRFEFEPADDYNPADLEEAKQLAEFQQRLR